MSKKDECFAIMPISDPDDYIKGHFQDVFSDIIVPACNMADYQAIRASDVVATNLIHLDILKRLLETPMAICDLSTSNPNVLFELGLRQAFDKPVVLIQEVGTPRIFDIAPLRYTEYRKELVYHQVLEDQENISKALKATKEETVSKIGINSIVKLLSIVNTAKIKEIPPEESTPMLQVILAELQNLRHEFRNILISRSYTERKSDFPRWSESYSLSRDASSPPISYFYPILGSTGVDINPIFGWPVVKGAVSYEFEISRDIGQTDKFYLKDEVGISNINVYKPSVTLEYDTTYWWRVRAVSSIGVKSAWNTSFFSTTKQPTENETP